MLKGVYIMNDDTFDLVYSPDIRKEIETYVDIKSPLLTQRTLHSSRHLLKDIDVIFSGWGGPQLNKEFLMESPHLKALFYAAGSVKGIVTEEMWKRDILITSAYEANAYPVAEYTLSQIIFSLKKGWQFAQAIKNKQRYIQRVPGEIPGFYNKTIGIISLGMVGRRVCELLRPFDVKVIAYDPFFPEERAKELNIELCSLEELFKRADVVSLHAPWLKETEGLIKGKHFEMMRPGSTFINTARGAIVEESQMLDVLSRRDDLFAILDVTYPEPPDESSRIFTLPNVILTPHIAGSEGDECQRMADFMLQELKRYINGEPLKWQITKEKAAILA